MFRNTFPGEVLVHKQGWFNGLIPETKQAFENFTKLVVKVKCGLSVCINEYVHHRLISTTLMWLKLSSNLESSFFVVTKL